ELEEARYEASLAARRYEVVDPTKRLVARELEARWNTALERAGHLEDRIARHDVAAALRPKVDRVALMALARDPPAAWNAPRTLEPNSALPIFCSGKSYSTATTRPTRRSSQTIGMAGVTPNCASRACGPDVTRRIVNPT